MRRWPWRYSLIGLAALLAGCARVTAAPAPPPGTLLAVGTENFYADILHQIGGNRIQVVAVMRSPNADPHDYEPTTGDALAVAQADLVVMNGLDYDAWMQHLLDASPHAGRAVVVAGELAGLQPGDNPHVWYDLATIRRVARAITSGLIRLGHGANRAYFTRRERTFLASLRPIQRLVTALRQRYAGTSVGQTEPVFAYMVQALHLRIPQQGFQKAIQKGVDPPPQSIIAFESLLRRHGVAAIINNIQAQEPVTDTMVSVARQEGIPVVDVTETEPTGKNYQQWVYSEVRTLGDALARKG